MARRFNFDAPKTIEFSAEIIHETDKAYLLSDGTDEFWMPKSQIKSERDLGDGNVELEIPEWLAEDKGIV